ncbi:VCBS repeat-containing protein [Moraxella sp. ZY210820]|uniref:FG-GAP repeat domain-containing protein n=1 Tax=unclassified Moraxella TaxID=2685852 RepID=UPI0027321C91|nr:VCBS repeat-containing protein [Moraxella sp. ZY210820]WLF84255.1 VCBS repeat-containing protein [Moraxella sp. ZY210820]
MKKWFVFSLCVLSSSILYAEERLIKDIDGDGKKDVIWLEDGTLHIKLSSQNHRVMRDIHAPLGDEPPFLIKSKSNIKCRLMNILHNSYTLLNKGI